MFWGVWGASIPRVQQQAEVSDSELGVALLCIGAGALPAMLLTGRLLDRWGLRAGGWLLPLLGLSGLLVVVGGDELWRLCLALGLVGVASGAVDVSINALAGRAELDRGRPVIVRAHGVFSVAVVVGSLGTGTAVGLGGLPWWSPFVLSAGLCGAVGWSLERGLPGAVPHEPPPTSLPAPTTSGSLPVTGLLLLGALGALAFAAENAHQSWSAVFATVELAAGPGTAAVAPAVFAAVVAVARFAVGGLDVHRSGLLVVTGSAVATAGSLVVAASPDLTVAVVGLALAAAGTGVLFPTLMSIMSRGVQESHRGRATSTVATVAYTGFLLGPVYVGAWSEAVGLRSAMAAVAGLTFALCVLAPGFLALAHRATWRTR